MKETAIARRYAKALVAKFPAAADLEALGRDLSAFSELFEGHRSLKMTMLNPSIPPEAKEAILSKVADKMGLSTPSRQGLTLILQKGRLGLVRFIAAEFERISFLALGKVRALVTSAAPLTDAEKEELRRSLTAFSGKEAVMEIRVDPSLIGGVVARIGSVVYDGSVANQLKTLRVRLG